MDIVFKYEEEEKKFELTKSNIKEKLFENKIMYKDPKKKCTSLRTIEAFTTYFPNLTRYQLLQEINPIDIIRELSINIKINDYFEIIKEKIKNISDKTNIYENKIKDYILNKIYEKIYPPEPDEKDNEIYKKTMRLSWVDPYSIVEKDYIYDTLMPDISNEFRQINIAKTPYRKYSYILKIKKYIESLIKFNEGLNKEVGLDDIAPVLNFVFIKSHPFRIYTDIEFIKVFLKNTDDFNLKCMESAYLYILEYKDDMHNFHM